MLYTLNYDKLNIAAKIALSKVMFEFFYFILVFSDNTARLLTEKSIAEHFLTILLRRYFLREYRNQISRT